MPPGAFLDKCDVRSAYRNVPVHPEDAGWLGLMWEGEVYADTTLPFGLRSAPKIFTAVADAFQWIVRRTGVQVLFHYIDDFVVIGEMEEECTGAMGTIQALAEDQWSRRKLSVHRGS